MMKPRAPRFPLQLAVRYRLVGEKQWQEAKTEDVSRSGLLLRAAGVMEPETPVELAMSLPAKVAGEPGANVIARGKVVRTLPAAGPGALSGVAVKMTQYRLMRAGGVFDL